MGWITNSAFGAVWVRVGVGATVALVVAGCASPKYRAPVEDRSVLNRPANGAGAPVAAASAPAGVALPAEAGKVLPGAENDGKAGYYVGMTGLTPEERFENHKKGLKAARVVRKCGERLVPKLYAHLNPMPYEKAREMEAVLAESLRKRGYAVFGGH